METEYFRKVKKVPYEYRLRLLVTSNCTLKCTYCHNDGQRQNFPIILTSEDYQKLFIAFYQEFGSRRVVISGGEPLVRRDIDKIVQQLHENGAEITLVTNGMLLDKHLEILKYLSKLHVSLDIINRRLFNEICGLDVFEHVRDNVVLVRDSNPYLRMKINSVLLKGINTGEKETRDLIDFGVKNNITNCFIEKMSNKDDPQFLDIDEFESTLLCIGLKIEDKTPLKTTFSVNSNPSQVELIRCFCPVARMTVDPSRFCNLNNNTLFINPNGFINACILSNRLIRIENLVKSGNITGLQIKLREVMTGLGFPCLLTQERKIHQ